MSIKLSAAIPVLFLVSGCTGLAEKITGRVDETDSKVSAMVKDTGRTAPGVVAIPAATVTHESGIWLGKNVVKTTAPVLPKIFYEPATFDRTVGSLSELAERITLRTGIPTRVSPDAQAILTGGTNGAAAAPGANASAGPALPSGLPGAPGATRGAGNTPSFPDMGSQGSVRIMYSNGNFKGLLDTAASRFGVSWKYADGAILFYHTESRTFQINAIPGDSSFSATVVSGATSAGGVTGGNSGGGGGVTANNSQNTGVTSRLSVYTSIENTVTAMVSPYGRVVASPATGAITVIDTPTVLDRIATYIDNENKVLSRQIVVNVTVLSVSLSDSDEYGINWNLIYQDLKNTYGIRNTVAASTDATAFSAGIVGTSKFSGSSLIINALSKQGKVRRQTTASVVTLNNQPVPVQVARQTSYLQSSQTTVTAQVGTTTTLTPGTVTAGFNMSILPHLLSDGTVMLQFSTDISALTRIRVVESGGSKIESPEMDTRNFLQRVAMKSNETLIISGFEQADENIDKQGVGKSSNYLFGGGYKAGSTKESIVILITPITMTGS